MKPSRDLVTSEVRSMVEEDDLRVIEEKITFAREVKARLNTKSGIQKFFHAREYHKLAKGVYRDAKSVSDRAADIYWATHWQAQSLYRCWLCCMNAYPSSLTQDKWVVDAWNEACFRTDAHPILRQEEEIKCDSMKLLNDMKTKTKSAVESLYEFDTSQAPQSIGRNASRAQALLAKTTFIYRDFDFGDTPRYPYRHPIIQKIVNITWFQNQDDIGIVFHEYFNPIPFEAIALAVTVIECCIDEWSTGTYKESSWKEGCYKTRYSSHFNSLRDLYTHGTDHEGRDLLQRIQDDLLRAARY